MHLQDIQEELILHPRNRGIDFEPDEHIYTRLHEHGEPEQYYGITSFLNKYAPFEGKKIKYAIAKRDGISVDEVQAEWDEARDWGKTVHDDLEQWGETGYEPELEVSKTVVHWLEKMQLRPVAAEFVVYCDELKRATPIDIPLVDRHGRLVVGDYKTSKNIKYDFYEYNKKKKRMEFPLTHLPTSNFYKYSLQLGIARTWLERYYGLSFPIAPYGILFHIRNGVFTPHKTLPMYSEIRAIYDWETRTN
jgi:hypothetical protein